MIASRAFPACVACVLSSTHPGKRADQAQHSITDAHQHEVDNLLPLNPSYCPGKLLCIGHDSQLAMQMLTVCCSKKSFCVCIAQQGTARSLWYSDNTLQDRVY